MTDSTTRFTITVPEEIAERAEALKKDLFYDRSYAEMYRQLIRLGMEQLWPDGPGREKNGNDV